MSLTIPTRRPLEARSRVRVMRFLPRGKWGIYLMVIVLAAIIITPFLWMLLGSFKSNFELMQRQGQTLWIDHPTLSNYVRLFQEYDFARYFLNSTIVATVTAVIATSLSAFAAYSLARFTFPGKGIISFLILLTQMIPVIATIIPLFIWFQTFHLLDTYWALIIAYNAFAIPFCTWLLRGFFMEIPIELEEAAMIDGASQVGVLLRIVLPISLPGLLATLIFSFILAWQEFLFAVTFTSSSELRTLTVGIAAMRGKDIVDWGLMNAGVVITTIPLAILFSFIQRFLIKGLTAGAVKG
jgi:multiple sugar transport system permease protein